MKSISYKNSSYAVQKIVPVHARPQCTIGRFDGTLGSSLDSHAETTRHSYAAIDEPASLYEGAKALRSARHPASSRAGRGPLHSQEPPLALAQGLQQAGGCKEAHRRGARAVREGLSGRKASLSDAGGGVTAACPLGDFTPFVASRAGSVCCPPENENQDGDKPPLPGDHRIRTGCARSLGWLPTYHSRGAATTRSTERRFPCATSVA
jgi:hypothetical protein